MGRSQLTVAGAATALGLAAVIVAAQAPRRRRPVADRVNQPPHNLADRNPSRPRRHREVS